MRFFLYREPYGSISISCEREAQGIYSVVIKGHRIAIPVKMEKELKEVVSRYMNGYGYDSENVPNKPYIIENG